MASTVKIGSYKGYPVLNINDEDGNYIVSFGTKKAKAILAHIQEIREFVDDNEVKKQRQKKKSESKIKNKVNVKVKPKHRVDSDSESDSDRAGRFDDIDDVDQLNQTLKEKPKPTHRPNIDTKPKHKHKLKFKPHKYAPVDCSSVDAASNRFAVTLPSGR